MTAKLDTPLTPEEAASLAEEKPPLRIGRYAEATDVLRMRGLAVGMHLGIPNEAFTHGSIQRLDGEAHHERRRLLAPLFSVEARRAYETEILPPALRASTRRHATGGLPAEVDLVPLLRDAVIQISGAMIGLDGMDGPATVERLLELAELVVPPVSARWTTNGAELIAKGLAARDAYIRELVAPARDRRRELLARGDRPSRPDLLTLHLEAGSSDEAWQSEAIVFLAASLGTTLMTTLHALLHLDGWVAADPARAAQLEELAFLRRAAAETVRLHPAIPEIVRFSVAEETVPASGRVIPAATKIEVDPFAADRDPDMYAPDPEVFDPERAVPERARDFGLGFGGGAHMCTGQRMAIESAQATASEDAPVGVVPRLLWALYRAGVELDPGRPPAFVPGNRQGKIASFPARLLRLP